MTKILSIGMGGVGVVASYVLSLNPDVEITAVIRSDFDTVTTRGYTISSIDYGGRRANNDPNEAESAIKGFKPHKIVKSLLELTEAYDYIIISTKVIPQDSGNIWDDIIKYKDVIAKLDKTTSFVLMQNGIDIEQYWKPLFEVANFISGVTYVSSVNDKGAITQYGYDKVLFGLFDFNSEKENVEGHASLDKFVELYNNDINDITVDTNVRYTRWRKLLYNASYNTVCCLTDLDVGKLYDLKDTKNIIERVIRPLMKEVEFVANKDLASIHGESYDKFLGDEDVNYMIAATEEYDAITNYQPSMLVDSRNGRMIELEIILGNIIKIYGGLVTNEDFVKRDIPYLNFLYALLTLVQHRLEIAI